MFCLGYFNILIVQICFIFSRIAAAALAGLKPIWRDGNMSLESGVKLMRSLVISVFLCACESWTLTAELEKGARAFEMRCYRRLLNISYRDHVAVGGGGGGGFAERSGQPLGNMTGSWPWSGSGGWDGLAVSQGLLV